MLFLLLFLSSSLLNGGVFFGARFDRLFLSSAILSFYSFGLYFCFWGLGFLFAHFTFLIE